MYNEKLSAAETVLRTEKTKRRTAGTPVPTKITRRKEKRLRIVMGELSVYNSNVHLFTAVIMNIPENKIFSVKQCNIFCELFQEKRHIIKKRLTDGEKFDIILYEVMLL